MTTTITALARRVTKQETKRRPAERRTIYLCWEPGDPGHERRGVFFPCPSCHPGPYAAQQAGLQEEP